MAIAAVEVQVLSRAPSVIFAGMAELVDALASGASGPRAVEVQVLFPAPQLAHLIRQHVSLKTQQGSFLLH